MLSGKEKMFSIGFSARNKIERIRPEMISVFIPPSILTPDKSSERIKSEIALNTVSLRIVFI